MWLCSKNLKIEKKNKKIVVIKKTSDVCRILEFVHWLAKISKERISFKLQGAIMLNREVGGNPTRSRRCKGWRKPYPPVGGEKATVRPATIHGGFITISDEEWEGRWVGWSPSQKTCPKEGIFSCGRQEKRGGNLIILLLSEKRVSPPEKVFFYYKKS